jgi:hypothetical protein
MISTSPKPRKPLQRKTPLRSRSLLKPSLRASIGKTVKAWKSSRQKSTPIRQSAKNEECTIRLPMVCNYDQETTVLCHSNELADGKGMSLKAPDTAAAYGCSACHDVVDGRRPRPEGLSLELVASLFRDAIAQTQRILKRKGLV